MSWKTLLLDNSYQPLQIITWTKAIELLLSGKAEIVEEYDDIFIRSPNLTLTLPSILKLISPFKKHKKKVKFSRYNIFYRDNWTCQYCNKKFKTEDLTFDHVIPKSRRIPESQKSWENIVTACWRCNHKKGSKTPDEAHMKLLKKPVKPDWTPQFTIRIKGNEPESWLSYLYWHSEIIES